MKTEAIAVASSWAIGGGAAQLLLVPFGVGSWTLVLGMVIGATTQAMVYYYRKPLPFVQ